MKTLVLGPTFRIPVDESVESVAARFTSWTESGGGGYESSHAGNHFQIAIAKPERHRWSPWLTLEVRECTKCETMTEGEEAGLKPTEVFGRFNPSPAIWTGYMLGSLALLTTALIAVMWATAELMLGEPPLALWVVPVCVLVLAVMWGISAAGQRLARAEMAEMQAAVERLLAAESDS